LRLPAPARALAADPAPLTFWALCVDKKLRRVEVVDTHPLQSVLAVPNPNTSEAKNSPGKISPGSNSPGKELAEVGPDKAVSGLAILLVLPAHDKVDVECIPGVPRACLALSADGRLLASGSADGAVEVRSLNDPTQSVLRALAHDFGVRGLAFAADGHQLVSNGCRGGVVTWRLRGWFNEKLNDNPAFKADRTQSMDVAPTSAPSALSASLPASVPLSVEGDDAVAAALAMASLPEQTDAPVDPRLSSRHSSTDKLPRDPLAPYPAWLAQSSKRSNQDPHEGEHMRKRFLALKSNLQKLVEANENAGELEKLSARDLVVDLALLASLEQAGQAQVAAFREAQLQLNQSKRLLHHRLKTQCWDGMETKLLVLHGLQSADAVANFPLPVQDTRQQRLGRMALFYRSMNVMENLFLNSRVNLSTSVPRTDLGDAAAADSANTTREDDEAEVAADAGNPTDFMHTEAQAAAFPCYAGFGRLACGSVAYLMCADHGCPLPAPGKTESDWSKLSALVPEKWGEGTGDYLMKVVESGGAPESVTCHPLSLLHPLELNTSWSRRLQVS
jgi:hypothetical protein